MTGAFALPADALARLAADLPDCLVSAAAASRLAALALAWPPGAVAQIMELRLDGLGGPVDASQAFAVRGLAALAARTPVHPELVALGPVLAWAAGSGRTRSLWLEWDLPQDAVSPSDRGAKPSLFLAPGQGGDAADFAAEALDRLGLRAVVPEFLRVMRVCPPSVTLRQVGVMLSRPDPVVRLVLDTGPSDRAVALVAVLRPELVTGLSALFGLPGFALAPRLDLDLTGQGVGGRLSLELPAPMLSPQDMTLAVHGLAARGVIHAGAAGALASVAAWHAVGDGATAGLNHLKASATPSGRIEVKAYLGLVATLSAPISAPTTTLAPTMPEGV